LCLNGICGLLECDEGKTDIYVQWDQALITNRPESFIAPTNAQHIYIKTLKFFTLKYITIAPTCFGFD